MLFFMIKHSNNVYLGYLAFVLKVWKIISEYKEIKKHIEHNNTHL